MSSGRILDELNPDIIVVAESYLRQLVPNTEPALEARLATAEFMKKLRAEQLGYHIEERFAADLAKALAFPHYLARDVSIFQAGSTVSN